VLRRCRGAGRAIFGGVVGRESYIEPFCSLYEPFTFRLYHTGIQYTQGVYKMKKIMFAVLIVVLALGVYASVASAQTAQQNNGLLHDYMEKALAEKLGIPLATVEAQFDAGKTLYQIALDNGIAQADLPALMLEVRTAAIKAAVADGVITQAQADRMLQARGNGLGSGQGYGMMRGAGDGTGVGPCGGNGNPVGTGMMRGGRWQQVKP
jgi:hypothetical protein